MEIEKPIREIANLTGEILKCESPRALIDLGIKALGASMYFTGNIGVASKEAGEAYITRKVSQAQEFLNAKTANEGKPPSDAVCENIAETKIEMLRKMENATACLVEQIKAVRQDALELVNLAKKKAELISQENLKVGS